jgi:hypothetical protein
VPCQGVPGPIFQAARDRESCGEVFGQISKL